MQLKQGSAPPPMLPGQKGIGIGRRCNVLTQLRFNIGHCFNSCLVPGRQLVGGRGTTLPRRWSTRFRLYAADPTLSHGQALQSSILTMINSTQHSEWADPKYGALRLRRRTSQAAELRAGGRTLISSVAVKSGQFIKTRPKRDQLQSDPRKSCARIYFI